MNKEKSENELQEEQEALPLLSKCWDIYLYTERKGYKNLQYINIHYDKGDGQNEFIQIPMKAFYEKLKILFADVAEIKVI